MLWTLRSYHELWYHQTVWKLTLGLWDSRFLGDISLTSIVREEAVVFIMVVDHCFILMNHMHDYMLLYQWSTSPALISLHKSAMTTHDRIWCEIPLYHWKWCHLPWQYGLTTGCKLSCQLVSREWQDMTLISLEKNYSTMTSWQRYTMTLWIKTHHDRVWHYINVTRLHCRDNS